MLINPGEQLLMFASEEGETHGLPSRITWRLLTNLGYFLKSKLPRFFYLTPKSADPIVSLDSNICFIILLLSLRLHRENRYRYF